MSVEYAESEVFEQINLSEQLATEQLARQFPTLAEPLGELAVVLVRADTEANGGSFKGRGAENAVSKLPFGTLEVATASAGSHARALAIAAAKRGLDARIVVPQNAPVQKSEDIYRLWEAHNGRPGGLTVVKHGDSFDDSLQFAKNQYPYAAFIHPYDNPDVIEGQGSLMADVKEAVPGVTDIVVPVGGGGLIKGLFKAANGVRVWGVEAKGSDSLSRSLDDAKGKLLEATAPNSLYAGAAVKRTGHTGLDYMRTNGFTSEQLTTANDNEVLDLAMYYYGQGERPGEQLEPTSLLAVAGLMKLVRAGKFTENNVVAVIGTGHNESPSTLVHKHRGIYQKALSGHIGS